MGNHNNYLLEELSRFPHWVCWKLVPGKDGKMGKVPFVASVPLARWAKSNDRSTWTDYDTAKQCAEIEGGSAGVSFALSLDLPYICIDLDHCLDPDTGEITGRAAEIVAMVAAACGGTYAEISPSGTGLHLWGRGHLPTPGESGIHKEVEIYRTGRFMTVTGNAWANCPLVNIQEAVDGIISRYNLLEGKREEDMEAARALFTKYRGRAVIDDKELVAKIRRSASGAKFSRLYDEGDISAYGNDRSRADMALLSILAWWTNGNPYQMGRIFLKSALSVEIGRKIHHEGKYLNLSISNALLFFSASGGEGYRPHVVTVRPIDPAAYQEGGAA